MKTNPNLIRRNQATLTKAFPPEISKVVGQYFIPASHYEAYKDHFPYNIHPLAFFDYDEGQIRRELDLLGWQAPTDTDANSTNCQLNAFANQCHIQRHGFHPYVWEIASLVRQAVMDRDEGMEKIYSEQSQKMIKYAKERLGL